MIHVDNLTYRYPNTKIDTLHGLHFDIKKQEIFGFLGPSGSGKSTTQKILFGLLKGYSGRANVLGREVSLWEQDYFERVGICFEQPNHYLKLTGLENLSYFRSLYEGDTYTPTQVLKWVGLEQDADKPVSAFSKGMKVRLNVARSIIHKPDVLFMDEPTAGLDPRNARNIKDLILKLRDRGATIFITTHNMMVADQLCDRIGLLDDGKITVIESPDVLKKQHGQRTVRVEYIKQNGATDTSEFPIDELAENKRFLDLLKSARHIETIHTNETTLEDIFIKLTGNTLHN